MDQAQRLAVFEAQTTNVRELQTAWTHINRQINSLLVRKQSKAVEVTTKSLSLIYCALAESIFSKLIHTPHGLTLDEISQVKSAARNGVKFGWTKCAELSTRYVSGKNSGHNANLIQTLGRMIESYIFDPSLLRNKLAHGQWCIALNRENDRVNADATAEIQNLNVIELYKRKQALEKLAQIIEDIIESPNKAHPRDYWPHIVDLEKTQLELSSWTMQKKIDQLLRKQSAHLQKK